MMHTVLPREEAVEAIFSKKSGRAFYRSFISGIQEWRYQCIVAGIVWKKYV